MSEQQGQQLQIEIDDETAKGRYSNLAMISHSETEFLLDFTMLQPQNQKTKVHTRIISSPIHLKRLLLALQDNISKYEERFGEIQVGKQTPPEPAQIYQ
ncbi:MAG: hypothetical protein COB53_11405 [Elusimicrobia bacterium]|nr:MAG: hypothetical protein COB53_11405 [Elusimicrobiota bacterium]